MCVPVGCVLWSVLSRYAQLGLRSGFLYPGFLPLKLVDVHLALRCSRARFQVKYSELGGILRGFMLGSVIFHHEVLRDGRDG